MTVIKDAIEKIIEMAAPNIINMTDDTVYSDRHLHPILNPVPDPLSVATLSSLLDYLERNVDSLERDGLMVHVETFNKVSLLSALDDPFEQRKVYIQASAMTPTIHFERRMDPESFIIQLQSMFVKTYQRDNLLKFLGSLKAGFSKTMSDNGVSQTVTAKTGVTMVSDVEVPNPVTLQPYRTFTEIEQPTSDFVFRIHGGQDEPTCALYEADGGAWKLVAIERIAEWLRENLPDVAVIA